MKTLTTATFALALGLGAALTTGCAGSDIDVGDPNDPNDPNDPDDDDVQTEPLRAEGSYLMQSEFNMIGGIPGTAGDVIDTLVTLTQGSNQPTHGLLQLAIDNVENSTIRSALQAAQALAESYINDRLLEIAPDFVSQIIDFGDAFAQAAQNFGTLSELDITRSGESYDATHTVNGIAFKVDGIDYTFDFADYGISDVTANNVGILFEQTGKLEIGAHKVPMAYGSILRVAVDQLLVPRIDPLATDLNDALKSLVDCYELGWAAYEAVDIGSPATYETACNLGLDALAGYVYNRLEALDGTALEYDMSGVSRGVDTSGDRKVDEIQRGTWSGTVTYGNLPADLQESTYIGTRM